MAKEDFEQLEQKLKFGSSNERLQAILAMGKLTDETERVGALMVLWPIAKGEETKDVLEQTSALLSILQLNEGGFVQRTLPEVYEIVRDKWLELIREAAQDTKILPVWESSAIDALALAENDEGVTEGLIEAVRCARDESRVLVEHCLRAIGALGHESGREMLEYWQSKGNVSAQAALEAFGEPMEAIKDREKAIKAGRKAKREEEEKEKLEEDKCFIATAAYGSAAAPDVVILRELRDLRLKQTQVGCLMIRAYERWSPALAQAIVRHPFAGRTVRWLIVAPAAWIAQRLLSSSDRREIQGGNHG